MREELVRACDCRLVTGRGDGGGGCDGCEAGDGEERADCRLSYLVFDADSAEESRRRSVAATVKEEELASGVMRARAVMATMAAPLARHRSHRRQRRAQREERVSKQRQPWARHNVESPLPSNERAAHLGRPRQIYDIARLCRCTEARGELLAGPGQTLMSTFRFGMQSQATSLRPCSCAEPSAWLVRCC